MENATKALYIAGMLLIALLVVALVAHTFNDVGIVQDEKDKKEFEESIYKFNREYEVFNKKVMYGTDVISCINKAVSNNEKYEKNGKYSTTGASGKEVLINVDVTLKKLLEDSFEFKYIDKDSKSEKEIKLLDSSSFKIDKDKANDKSNSYLNKCYVKEFFGVADKDMFNNSITKYTTLWDVFNTSIPKSTPQLKLLETSRTKITNSDLYTIAKFSNDLELVVYNSSSKGNEGIFSLPSNCWSSIVWKTCLADFKSRKFKCLEIKYDDTSGLVNEIYFTEI